MLEQPLGRVHRVMHGNGKEVVQGNAKTRGVGMLKTSPLRLECQTFPRHLRHDLILVLAGSNRPRFTANMLAVMLHDIPDRDDNVFTLTGHEIALLHCEALQLLLSAGGSKDVRQPSELAMREVDISIAQSLTSLVMLFMNGLKSGKVHSSLSGRRCGPTRHRSLHCLCIYNAWNCDTQMQEIL